MNHEEIRDKIKAIELPMPKGVNVYPEGPFLLGTIIDGPVLDAIMALFDTYSTQTRIEEVSRFGWPALAWSTSMTDFHIFDERAVPKWVAENLQKLVDERVAKLQASDTPKPTNGNRVGRIK